MNQKPLLPDLPEDPRWDVSRIKGLSLHSHDLQPGDVFLAVKGLKYDGRTYIQDAIQKGASAIICEAEGLAAFHFNTDVPILPVLGLSLRLSELAARFYGEPSSELEVYGITGTNGKTTTSFLLSQSLTKLGFPCAVLGTLGYGFVKSLHSGTLTTPDAVTLQKYLRELKNEGVVSCAMEVSSHGLDQNRVSNIQFVSALFTNLTQDHLDYHKSMFFYGKAKEKLFQFPSLKRAIINADSSYAQNILSVIRNDMPIAYYSIHHKPSVQNRKNLFPIFTKSVDLDQKGIRAKVSTPWGEGWLCSPLIGLFNLSNLLGVLAELCLQGIPFSKALNILGQATGAPGRMECFGGVTTAQVIIDYAHTPDALENALHAARLHCKGKLWCVFGCGGDRDKNKRAKMGNIAGCYADHVIVTSDNPRTEDPGAIIKDILEGVALEFSAKIEVEQDREQAIRYTISRALPMDTVVIAGKGHEDYQLVGDKKIPFSDVAFVKALLKGDNNDENIHHC